MIRLLRIVFLSIVVALISGCLYDSAPSGPSRSIDTWLIGLWQTEDASGHVSKVTVAPGQPGHYIISFLGSRGRSADGFDAWLSRVDDFSILVLKSSDGKDAGKHILLHHELLSPTPAPAGGVGSPRIRVSELQLDPSARSLDPYHLRRVIREALKRGDLLAPYDVASDRKVGGSKVPGSVIWTKTGNMALDGETF